MTDTPTPRKRPCRCGHPLYWCSSCGTYHHEPWGETSDCERAGGPFPMTLPEVGRALAAQEGDTP